MIAALVVSTLLVLPAVPAQAAPPEVQITALSSTVNAGQRTTLKFTVANKNLKLPPMNKDSVTIKVTSFGELTCEGQCDFTDEIDREASKEYTVTLVAGNVPAGDTKSGRVQVSAKIGDEQAAASRDVTVRGPQPQVQTVKEVSGKVVDSATGQAVANAVVGLLDSQQHAYSTTTNNTGSYRFLGTAEHPIAPGSIELGASKADVRQTKTINASAGQTVTNQRIALKLQAAPTATPTAEATEEPTEDATPGAETTDDATPGAPQAASDEESGFGSWLLIIVGGLFVAVGVGTIVLLWMRRKEQGDDEDGTGGPAPAGRGGYRNADDRTRIVNRPGAADPTMVGGQSMADAPTMMHSRPLVEDEYPDKYAAPLPSQQPQASNYGAADSGGWAGSGYGDAAGTPAGYGDAAGSQAGYGYGNAPASGAGYGNAPASGAGYGNAPASGAGYGNRDYGAPTGAASGGYPPARSGAGYGERYDEPTGRYDGGTEQYTPPADPYATGTYSPPAESSRGYGQEQSYGRGQEPTGGYGQGGGYGAPTSGYDSGQGQGQSQGQGQGYGGSSGYGQRDYSAPGGGYDQPAAGGGYDQRGGYDRAPEQPGAYDNRYEQGGYYGAPPQGESAPPQQPPQQDRPGRRSLDWLDD